MVQKSDVKATDRRERKRIERHRAFLQAAKEIAFAEGLSALTMQRLARDLDCAVGTAYSYFPSKSALVAEVQREAIEVIDESCARFEALFERHIGAAEPDGAIRSLAFVKGYTRFWVDTFETFPEEARLLQLLMSDTSRSVEDADVSRVVPAALRLLDRVRTALDRCVEEGALATAPDDESSAGSADAMERTVVLASSLNGVLLLDHVARVDPELFDSRRLAGRLVDDLLAGWGADRSLLAAAVVRLDRLAGSGPLATKPAPPVGGEDAQGGEAR